MTENTTPKPPVSGYRSHVVVELSSGEILDVRTKLTDVLRWEKNNNGQGWLTHPMPLDRQLWVVWCAARRSKLTDSMDADGWIAQIVDFEVVDDVEVELELDPTEPKTSTD